MVNNMINIIDNKGNVFRLVNHTDLTSIFEYKVVSTKTKYILEITSTLDNDGCTYLPRVNMMLTKKFWCRFGIDRKFICSGDFPNIKLMIDFLNELTY